MNHSRTTIDNGNDDISQDLKRTTNQFIFNIPELEEDEPIRNSSKYGKIKPMQCSQNSDITSGSKDSNENSGVSRKNSNNNNNSSKLDQSIISNNETSRKRSNMSK